MEATQGTAPQNLLLDAMERNRKEQNANDKINKLDSGQGTTVVTNIVIYADSRGQRCRA